MKNKGLLILVAILGILFFWGCNVRRNLVNADEDIKTKWAEVQNQYKRRAEVFMNLAETVKGAAANEKGILTAVTNARAGISEAQSKMGSATTPAELDKQLQAVQTAATTFKIQVEAYPAVRSTEAYLKLQDEISGTENRVSKVREDYIKMVNPYNKMVRNFPTNIFANVFGFGVKENFKAKDSEQDAQKVDVMPK
jgi:LemA protein